jgi:hypothetical protein
MRRGTARLRGSPREELPVFPNRGIDQLIDHVVGGVANEHQRVAVRVLLSADVTDGPDAVGASLDERHRVSFQRSGAERVWRAKGGATPAAPARLADGSPAGRYRRVAPPFACNPGRNPDGDPGWTACQAFWAMRSGQNFASLNELRSIRQLFVCWADGPNGEPDPWPMEVATVMVVALAHEHTPAKSPNCSNVDGGFMRGELSDLAALN